MQTSAEVRHVLWPKDLAHRYGKDPATIWRWRQAGYLPPPDLRIADKAGWYVATIEAHERSTATGGAP